MRPKSRRGQACSPAPPPACASRPKSRSAGFPLGVLLPPHVSLPSDDTLVRCRAARLLAAAFVHVPPQDLEGTRGRAPVTLARHVALYVAHVTLGVPRGAVADHFGRDRTSIAYACARMEQRREAPDFDRALSALEACAAHAVAQGVLIPLRRAEGAVSPVSGALA